MTIVRRAIEGFTRDAGEATLPVARQPGRYEEHDGRRRRRNRASKTKKAEEWVSRCGAPRSSKPNWTIAADEGLSSVMRVARVLVADVDIFCHGVDGLVEVLASAVESVF